uniref:Uncharacterized protein n=1 Tax=Anguilla anguilla TaxID=7936 RepID=A0A0E9UHT7_ANGAN
MGGGGMLYWLALPSSGRTSRGSPLWRTASLAHPAPFSPGPHCRFKLK